MSRRSSSLSSGSSPSLDWTSRQAGGSDDGLTLPPLQLLPAPTAADRSMADNGLFHHPPLPSAAKRVLPYRQKAACASFFRCGVASFLRLCRRGCGADDAGAPLLRRSRHSAASRLHCVVAARRREERPNKKPPLGREPSTAVM